MRKKFVPASYDSLLNYVIIFVHIISILEHDIIEINLKDHGYYHPLILPFNLFCSISTYYLVS